MADNIFSFDAQFNEFTPVYRDVSEVWIGDGSSASNKSGMLYAKFVDGSIKELGYVSMYNLAVENGYTGTEAEWVQAMMTASATVQGATSVTTYANGTSGSNPPTSGWSSTPNPVIGSYLWAKTVLTWVDSTTSTIYTVSYNGDALVSSVNGLTGAVVINGANIAISGNSNETIKSYIDNLVFEPEVATDAQIDALFGT